MESDLWNSFTLPPPPVLSYRLCCEDPKIAVNKLLGVCDMVCRAFHNVNSVNAEAAVLSRIIYRMKLQFRNDKGFKTLQRLNRVVRNTLVIDTNGVFNQIQKTLTDVYGPTRQMMEYTLVTLQSLAKLFDRIYKVSLEAGTYFRQRLKLGHMWVVALVVLSVVSRLWVLSQYIVRSACRWYNQLFRFLYVLQPSLTPWLPEGYHLPDDLYEWMGKPSYVMEDKQHSVVDNDVDLDIALKPETALEDIGVPVTAKMIFHNPNRKKRKGELLEQSTSNGTVLTNHTIEDKIKLSKEKISSPSLVQEEEGRKKHSIAKIKSHFDLLQFIRTEKKLHKLKRSQENNNFESMSTKFYTENLVKSQMKMFNKEMKTYLRELKLMEGDEEKVTILLKTIRKKIKHWVK